VVGIVGVDIKREVCHPFLGEKKGGDGCSKKWRGGDFVLKGGEENRGRKIRGKSRGQ